DQVLFFPDVNFPCPQLTRRMKTNLVQGRRTECSKRGCHYLHGRSHEPQSGLLSILRVLASAQFTVDLCIFIISFPTLADLLIDLHRNNVKVRIITDGSEDEAIASKCEELRNEGIVIKSNVRGLGALMHHKFAIVDNRTVLTGSFNWTKKAIISNYDNVLVTSATNLTSAATPQAAANVDGIANINNNNKYGSSLSSVECINTNTFSPTVRILPSQETTQSVKLIAIKNLQPATTMDNHTDINGNFLNHISNNKALMEDGSLERLKMSHDNHDNNNFETTTNEKSKLDLSQRFDSTPTATTKTKRTKKTAHIDRRNYNDHDSDDNDTSSNISVEKSKQPIKVSDIIGDFGVYQIVVVLFAALRAMCTSMDALSGPFLAPNIKNFQCELCDRSSTGPGILPIDMMANSLATDVTINNLRQHHQMATQYARNNNNCSIRMLNKLGIMDDYVMDTSQCYFTSSMGAKDDRIMCTRWSFVHSSGYQNMHSLTIEQSLVCDREWLKSLSNSMYFVGNTIGLLFWGVISDKFGRKTAYVCSHIVTLVFGFSALFAKSMCTFILLRSIGAFGMIGELIPRSILVEIVAARYRYVCSVICQIGWATGLVLVPLVATYNPGYRFILGVPVTISALMLPWLIWLPESARWLMAHGNYLRARAELIRAATINGKLVPDIDAKIQQLNRQVLHEEMTLSEGGGGEGGEHSTEGRQSLSISDSNKKRRIGILPSMVAIFTNRRLCRDTLSVFVLLFMAEVVYFSLTLNVADLGGSLYINFIVSGLVEFVSIGVCGLLLAHVSRRACLSLLLLASTLSYLAMAICNAYFGDMDSNNSDNGTMITLIVNGFGKLTAIGNLMVIILVSQEVFPTIIRQFGTSLCVTIGKLGSAVAPFTHELGQMIGQVYCFSMFSVLCLLCAIIPFALLSETGKRELPDTVIDVEQQHQQQQQERSTRRASVAAHRIQLSIQLIDAQGVKGSILDVGVSKTSSGSSDFSVASRFRQLQRQQYEQRQQQTIVKQVQPVISSVSSSQSVTTGSSSQEIVPQTNTVEVIETNNQRKENQIQQQPQQQQQTEIEQQQQTVYGAVDGVPGVDFPGFTSIPNTKFTCSDKQLEIGLYADEETGCQVYHMCYSGRRESFLCGIGTVFNQAILACDFWYSVRCAESSRYYSANADFGKSVPERSNLQSVSKQSAVTLTQQSSAAKFSPQLSSQSSNSSRESNFVSVNSVKRPVAQSAVSNFQSTFIQQQQGGVKGGSTLVRLPQQQVSVGKTSVSRQTGEQSVWAKARQKQQQQQQLLLNKRSGPPEIVVASSNHRDTPFVAPINNDENDDIIGVATSEQVQQAQRSQGLQQQQQQQQQRQRQADSNSTSFTGTTATSDDWKPYIRTKQPSHTVSNAVKNHTQTTSVENNHNNNSNSNSAAVVSTTNTTIDREKLSAETTTVLPTSNITDTRAVASLSSTSLPDVQIEQPDINGTNNNSNANSSDNTTNNISVGVGLTVES
ncbi:Organic cation transporter-like protein, partial [Fragariocoptes setiger]